MLSGEEEKAVSKDTLKDQAHAKAHFIRSLPGRNKADKASTSMAGKHETTLRAIGVVLGVHLVNVITTGFVNSFGIMLRSLESDPSSPYRQESHFKMGFVIGCANGFIFVLGPFGNILTSRYGVRLSIGLGVFLMTFALMMASLAMHFWQLLLSLGVLYGLGASFAFVPAMGLPSQFFPEKRSLATGLASSGTALGAMILSPVVQAVIDGASVQWSLRTLGFIALGLGTCAVALCKDKSNRNQVATQYKFMDLSVLKSPGYPFYLAFAFLQMFGYVLPVLTLPNYARALGLSDQRGSNIIVVFCAGNFVGRLLAGVLSEQLGVFNILFLFSLSSGLLCLVCWIFAKSFAVLAIFSCLWGIGAGAYWALTVPATARLVGMPKLGSAVSINYLVNVIPPVFTSSIGSVIEQATASHLQIDINDVHAYRYMIIWAGLSYIVPAFILLLVRCMQDRRLFAKV